MHVHLLQPGDLTAEHLATWRRLQQSDATLASPYFCPEFTLAVGDMRDDARVAVLEEDDKVKGFFPYQRRPLGVGKPIGGPLSDYQGVIADSDLDWDAADLVRRCGLVAYDFDHMLTAQEAFAPHRGDLTDSPIIDLRDGYDAYVAERRAAGSRVIKSTARKRRKLEREVGPVRFELHEESDAVFETLRRWKRRQYAATGAYDVFAHDWTMALLKRLCAMQSEDFAGVFSTLYANDQLISLHFGMRSRTVWHQWFPAYDRDFLSYSPGLMLSLEMAAVAPAMGVTVIDMGWGRTEDKERLTNGAIPICVGRVELASPVTGMRRLRRGIEDTCAALPLGPLATAPSKVFYRLERHFNFR